MQLGYTAYPALTNCNFNRSSRPRICICWIRIRTQLIRMYMRLYICVYTCRAWRLSGARGGGRGQYQNPRPVGPFGVAAAGRGSGVFVPKRAQRPSGWQSSLHYTAAGVSKANQPACWARIRCFPKLERDDVACSSLRIHPRDSRDIKVQRSNSRQDAKK